MAALAWAWYALCALFGFFVLMPLGWVVVGAACILKAWKFPYANSIKPLTGRKQIDGWAWPINAVYGNPEDGVSGVDAYGPSWIDSYNPMGSRWRAFRWSGLRNWAAGFNYLTWPWKGAPPLLIKQYSVLGSPRQLKIGWQPRYGKIVMVCSA